MASAPPLARSAGELSVTVRTGDEPHAVGVRQGEVEVVGRHDDGEAVTGEVGDDQGQLHPAGDVEERRRLVEDEHGRLLGEGAGDEDPLALAVGQLAERSVPQRVDTEAGGGGMGDVAVLDR